MKVVISYPGHLRTVPMSGHAMTAFQSLGWDVVPFDHGHKRPLDRLIKHFSREAFAHRRNRAFMQLIQNERPDLVFVLYGKVHDPITIRSAVALGCKTACWWLDDPFSFGHEQDFLQAAEFDRYYTNCLGSVADYVANGVTKASFLPVGCTPTHGKAATPIRAKEPDIDVLFAGDWHPLRQQAMESLIGTCRIGVVGPWVVRKTGKHAPIRQHLLHEGYFSPTEMLQWFSRSKIVLNLHTWHGKWDSGVNPRLFEVAGSGAFQLCDRKLEIPTLYEPDHEIVLYDDISQLPSLVREWLPQTDRRKAIATAAQSRSLRDHTYEARIRFMLKDLGL